MLKYHYKLQLKLARYKVTNKPAHWLQITTHKLMAAHSGFGKPQSAQKLLLGSAQICSATSQFDKATCIAFCIESIHCLHSCSDSVMKLQRKINTFIVNIVSASATKWQKLEGDKTRKHSWLLLWKIFFNCRPETTETYIVAGRLEKQFVSKTFLFFNYLCKLFITFNLIY